MGRSKQKLAAEAPAIHAPLPAMVTYAQNFEDIILRRGLSDIAEGFYVDLGAYEPISDSVTYWFYQNGWSGVNVEPNPELFAMLCEARPRDTNLKIVVAGRPGKVTLHINTGLSTVSPEIAATHTQMGLDMSQTVECESITLEQLFAEHVGDRTVDFLKIDIEGSEEEVLGAASFEAVRPRIVVVEATEPNSTVPSWRGWEPGLLEKGYVHVWFDGLNRFYVRKEDQWRAKFFTLPVNIFDNYIFPLSHVRVENGNWTLGEFNRLRDEGDRLAVANGEIERERDERAAAVKQLADETLDLRLKGRERDATLLAVRAVAEAAETNLMAARAELETHHARIAEADDIRSSYVRTVEELEAELGRLRAQVGEQDAEIASAEDRVLSAENRSLSAEDRVLSAENRLLSAEDRVRSNEDILSIALTELVVLREQEAERTIGFNDAKAEVALFQKRLGERTTELTAVRAHLARAHEERDARQAQVAQMRKESAADRSRLAQTQARFEEAFRQLWRHLLIVFSSEQAPAEANRKGGAFYALFGRKYGKRARLQGDKARDTKQWALAVRHYHRSLVSDPFNVPIWVQYGHALKECGRLSDAEDAYRQALIRKPAVADTHLQIGHVLKLQGRMKEAYGAYLYAAALDPSKPDHVQELALFGWPPSELSQIETLFGTLQMLQDDPALDRGTDIPAEEQTGAGPSAANERGIVNAEVQAGRDGVEPAPTRVSVGD